ncbi:MAG: hypothetical protein AB1566_14915 [Chloroflexota bacterium]
MLKHDKMNRVIMGVLAVMLVASLVLAVASHVAYAAPSTPPQPLTYCWDYYTGLWMCDTHTHQYWQYWCHRCCNEPDYCPTGCCDIYCWWKEAGQC